MHELLTNLYTSELELEILRSIILCYLIFTDKLLTDMDDTELSKFL